MDNCTDLREASLFDFTTLPLLYVMKDVRDQFQNNFQISPLAHPLGIEGVYWNHNIKY
jgi:hypothetical protein